MDNQQSIYFFHAPFNVWIQEILQTHFSRDVLLHNHSEFSYLACSILDLSNNVFVREFLP